MIWNNQLFYFLVFVGMGSLVCGQDRRGHERIETLKIAFITERLDLSPAEARQFWPIYNQHEDDLRELRERERLEIGEKIREAESLDEARATQVLNELSALEDERHRMEQAFRKELSTLLSAQKTCMLIKAEEEFKRRLLREMRNRRRGR